MLRHSVRSLTSATAAASHYLPPSLTDKPIPECILFNPAAGLENGNGVYHLTMNRPKALNALNLDSVRFLAPFYMGLIAKTQSPSAGDGPHSVGAVILKGAGDKAFCAGGDVRGILNDIPPGASRQYVYTQYQGNNALGLLPVPQVAFWDGIVMGGGAGMSMPGSHRLASEHTLFAMPEILIGFPPDVGASWFLPRATKAHDGLGLYLALTGSRLKGADAVHAGLATHYVPRSLQPKVEHIIVHESGAALRTPAVSFIDKCAVVDAIIDDVFASSSSEARSHHSLLEQHPFTLGPYLTPVISRCFGSHIPDVETVIETLRTVATDKSTSSTSSTSSNTASLPVSEWAQQQLEHITTKCPPAALKAAFATQRRGAKVATRAEALAFEFVATKYGFHREDSKNAITALLIDKTRHTPVWQPPTLGEVTRDMTEEWFKPKEIEWHPTRRHPEWG